MEIRTERIISVVGPTLSKKLFEFKLRHAALNAGYKSVREWHATVPDGWGEFPAARFRRNEIFHGRRETFGYAHHQAISAFKGKYVASWSNSPIDEDKPGQEVHYAVSDDLEQWTEDRLIVHTDPSSGIIRNNAGMCVHDGKLYNFVGVIGGARSSADPSLTSFVPELVRLDVYVTEDLETWEEYVGIAEDVYLFEGPRALADGSHMCCGRSFFGETQPVVLRWKEGRALSSAPERIGVPEPDRRIQGLQGTWYQTDDRRIWLYLRDAGMSARLALSWSEDGGTTWSDVTLTDMPNTCSRAHAGRLNDGRYYIIGNNYENLLDRADLMVALSDDGETFDSMYTLVSGKTHRRIEGLHKEDGWHYPNSMVDGDRLIVVFSVNKEDIYCGSVDTTTME